MTNQSIPSLSAEVMQVKLAQIQPSSENPRGHVSMDASFERLVNSIDELGILVPLVVRKTSTDHYELVDGERRFLAAQQLRLSTVPAHVLTTSNADDALRKFMFHLHMTREQWPPLAQCKALAEMYPQLGRGIKLADKAEWIQRIHVETWMNEGTARDRVQVLAWPKSLKTRIYAFDEKSPDRNVYSYVLAIEVSVLEPSVKAMPGYYNHGKPIDASANQVRASLLDKTLRGMETGAITSRDQIRSISPLFQTDLDGQQMRIAQRIFVDLVEKDCTYDDTYSQIQTRLPEVLAEKPPKPSKLVGLIRSLTETLACYEVGYIENSIKRESMRKKMKGELADSLAELTKQAKRLKDEIV